MMSVARVVVEVQSIRAIIVARIKLMVTVQHCITVSIQSRMEQRSVQMGVILPLQDMMTTVISNKKTNGLVKMWVKGL